MSPLHEEIRASTALPDPPFLSARAASRCSGPIGAASYSSPDDGSTKVRVGDPEFAMCIKSCDLGQYAGARVLNEHEHVRLPGAGLQQRLLENLVLERHHLRLKEARNLKGALVYNKGFTNFRPDVYRLFGQKMGCLHIGLFRISGSRLAEIIYWYFERDLDAIAVKALRSLVASYRLFVLPQRAQRRNVDVTSCVRQTERLGEDFELGA